LILETNVFFLLLEYYYNDKYDPINQHTIFQKSSQESGNKTRKIAAIIVPGIFPIPQE